MELGVGFALLYIREALEKYDRAKDKALCNKTLAWLADALAYLSAVNQPYSSQAIRPDEKSIITKDEWEAFLEALDDIKGRKGLSVVLEMLSVLINACMIELQQIGFVDHVAAHLTQSPQ